MTEIMILGVLTAAWVCGAFFFWRAGAWLPYYLLGAGGTTILITLAGRELFPLQDWLHEGVAATVQWTARVFGISATVPGSPAGAPPRRRPRQAYVDGHLEHRRGLWCLTTPSAPA